MKTALIILNYNSFNDLISLVNQLTLSVHKEKYTVIVIDNNSSKDSEKLDEYFYSKNAFFTSGIFDAKQNEEFIKNSLYYIKLNENKGYSYGNNVGLKLAYKLDFKLAFIINPDVSISDFKIFDDATSVFSSNKRIGVLGYRVILPNGKNQGPFKYRLSWDLVLRNMFFPFYDIIKIFILKLEKNKKGYITIPAVVGCFVGFDLEKMHLVDYYDENVFLYFEEYIISERMRQKGYLTVYCDNFFVKHNHDYESDLKSTTTNPHGEFGRNHYEKTYLKLSPLSIKILKLSQIYYETLRRIITTIRIKINKG